MFSMSGKLLNTALYTTLITVLVLQVLSTLERQVFDFLGFMWAPIIANFIQIICCIIGCFGICQSRDKYVLVYTTWSLMWLGWNIFVICLYLEVGVLNRNRDLFILNFATKNKSWWLEHGIGCKITNDSWMDDSSSKSSRPIPPEEVVEGCILDYYYVEVIHAGVQCLLALVGFISSCVNIFSLREDEESSAASTSSQTHDKPQTASSGNDEIEFVKMYTNSSPSRRRNKSPSRRSENSSRQGNDNHFFLNMNDEYPTLPPSYEKSMQESVPVNIYGADRQSVRSLRSVRSKSSNKSKSKQSERREELPWVQITPSPSTNMESPFRHYP